MHIMGLLSDGGVHSHINHLMAIIDILKENNIKPKWPAPQLSIQAILFFYIYINSVHLSI